MKDHSPASGQGGEGCDAGESSEEPLFLRPRRAKFHGMGPSGPRERFVFYLFWDFARRRRSWFWIRQYAKGPTM